MIFLSQIHCASDRTNHERKSLGGQLKSVSCAVVRTHTHTRIYVHIYVYIYIHTNTYASEGAKDKEHEQTQSRISNSTDPLQPRRIEDELIRRFLVYNAHSDNRRTLKERQGTVYTFT